MSVRDKHQRREAKNMKYFRREVYVCKECQYITIGCFAKARMARHGQLHHGWHYYDENRKSWNQKLRFKRNIGSEKDITPKEREQIINIYNRFGKVKK